MRCGAEEKTINFTKACFKIQLDGRAQHGPGRFAKQCDVFRYLCKSGTLHCAEIMYAIFIRTIVSLLT